VNPIRADREFSSASDIRAKGREHRGLDRFHSRFNKFSVEKGLVIIEERRWAGFTGAINKEAFVVRGGFREV
jgi:hypothetical protein